MQVVEATAWGLTGGVAAGLINLAVAVKAAGFRWPWHEEGELAPRLFVTAVGIVVGGIVSAAAHTQVTGPWPALVMGISAPSVIRGILSGVEVSVRKQGTGEDGAG